MARPSPYPAELQADRRGTHMSRMIALVHEEAATLTPQELPTVLKRGLTLLDAPALKGVTGHLRATAARTCASSPLVE
ncbi:GTP cyclohydrolase, FolE2/MptA family [Streptomyces sp. NPDC004393]